MEQLFYVPEIAVSPLLPDEEALHCTRVLRHRKGDRLTLTDGKGSLYSVVLDDDAPRHCAFTVLNTEKQTAPHCRVHLVVAPTKNLDRMEWLVEKAVETGVNAITFIRTANSERRELKLQRINKIAIAAMKQSWNTYLPTIVNLLDFKTFINQTETKENQQKQTETKENQQKQTATKENQRKQTETKENKRKQTETKENQRKPTETVKLIAHCREDVVPARLTLRQACPPSSDALILIGPEGDFTADEVVMAIAAGFKPVTLSRHRLRTETAALAALITINALNSQ
jgi:16S rRNA (uracil1498-N3)-methyltransferase